ncbi:MAG: TonB-dependent receptor [Bacteroidia bacterium]
MIRWSFVSFVWAQTLLRGSVNDLQGNPIVGALVYLLQARQGTYTNSDGFFSFQGLPYGTYTLRITYLGMDTLWQNVELRKPIHTLSLRMRERDLELQSVEIIEQVSAPRLEKARVTMGVTQVSPRQIQLLPTWGAPDLAQYLQVLPGVVFTGDQGGQLYVRGGTPIQNKVLLDGAIIYSPFHTLSLFSTFETDILRQVQVYSAGFGAEYGGRISSVMDLRTRPGNFLRLGGRAYTTPIMSGLLVEGPIKKEKSSFLITGRTAYLHQTTPRLYPYVKDSLPFRFSDLYGKITLGNGPDFLNLFGFRHTDNVLFDPQNQITWSQTGSGLNFQALPAQSKIYLWGNLSYSVFKNTFRSPFEFRPRYSEVGGFNSQINFSYLLGPNELTYGVEILGFRTNFFFTNALGFITQQAQSNTEGAGYLRLRKLLSPLYEDETPLFYRWILEPSVRLHYYNNYGYLSLEPRLRAKRNFRHWGLQLAAGRYVQNLVSAVSDRDVVLLFQGFLTAPENLPSQRLTHALQEAYHALIGAEFQLTPTIQLSSEGWYKNFSQLTNINRQRLYPEDPNFITETGQAYGADVWLRYQNPHVYAYVAYSFQYNRRQDGRITYFPLWDRRHTGHLILNYRPGRPFSFTRYKETRWEFSLRWTLGSGLPFTQTLGFFEKLLFLSNGTQSPYPTMQGLLSILLSPNYNAARLPYYHRLDLTVKRRWLVGEALFEAHFSLLNAYNRPNVFYIDRITGRRYDQLPILPTLAFYLYL